MLEKPAFIQGLFAYQGRGLESPVSFPSPAGYTVPPDKRAQTIYFRAGNASGFSGWRWRMVSYSRIAEDS